MSRQRVIDGRVGGAPLSGPASGAPGAAPGAGGVAWVRLTIWRWPECVNAGDLPLTGRSLRSPTLEYVPDLPSVPDVPEPDVPEPDVPEPDGPEPDVPEPDVPEPDVPEPEQSSGNGSRRFRGVIMDWGG